PFVLFTLYLHDALPIWQLRRDYYFNDVVLFNGIDPHDRGRNKCDSSSQEKQNFLIWKKSFHAKTSMKGLFKIAFSQRLLFLILRSGKQHAAYDAVYINY